MKECLREPLSGFQILTVWAKYRPKVSVFDYLGISYLCPELSSLPLK